MRIKGRERRHLRLTNKIKDNTSRPRLVVFRSNKHIYAQLVDDKSSKVITGLSTLGQEFKESKVKATNKDGAKEIGKLIAQEIMKLGIKEIRFDRSGYKYHGRVKALAEGAREGGLVF